MRFDDFQARLATLNEDREGLLVLLDLGSCAGRLLGAQSRYLEDGLDAEGSTAIISVQLGALLGAVATMATEHGLSLGDIAIGNLGKVRDRAATRGRTSFEVEVISGGAEAAGYQRLAALTDENASDGDDPLSLSVPMLGLAGEVGTLLVAQKKAVRDRSPQATDPRFLATELGDVLWYASAVAGHCGLELESVMGGGVDTAVDRSRQRTHLAVLPAGLPVVDRSSASTERLPRLIVVRFQQARHEGRERAVLTLVGAEPNAFPDGPVLHYAASGKEQGFDMPQALGDTLSDNSRRSDGYRFHDALHLGFAAVLGWSPVTRQLLGVKRRSEPETDNAEDGARAIFAEEGVAAVLAKRATRMQGFLTDRSVDDETLEMVTTVVEDFEVAAMPSWLWRRAISVGFRAMRDLSEGPGGFLTADLDGRTLVYSRRPPRYTPGSRSW